MFVNVCKYLLIPENVYKCLSMPANFFKQLQMSVKIARKLEYISKMINYHHYYDNYKAIPRNKKLCLQLKTYHGFANGMCSIVDNEFVIAVNFQVLKSDHEPSKHRLCLEGDHTIHVPLVSRNDDCTVNLFRYI